MSKVYQVHGSPISRMTRVTWMLEELSADYQINVARLGSDDLKELSPSGKGPVLVDDGFILTDSAAICLYLAEQHPQSDMGPRNPQERALMSAWLHFILSEFEAPLWNKLKHRVLLPEHLRLDVKPWINAEFRRELATLENRLGKNLFAMGDRFTCVDVVLAHCGQWSRSGKFEITSDRVSDYFDRVLSRPAYARAVEAERSLIAK